MKLSMWTAYGEHNCPFPVSTAKLAYAKAIFEHLIQ